MTEIKRGEIWLADLSPTIGREQSGIRPVLIMSNNIFNKSFADLVFAVPVTSRDKKIRSHVAVLPPEGGLTLPSFIMSEALRSISKRRLIKRIGGLESETLQVIERNLRMLLDL